MPYGADVRKLEEVYFAGDVKIAVYPEVMQKLGLKAGQSVDEETAQKIIAENNRLYLAK
jgi:hypothetical protein